MCINISGFLNIAHPDVMSALQTELTEMICWSGLMPNITMVHSLTAQNSLQNNFTDSCAGLFMQHSCSFRCSSKGFEDNNVKIGAL